MPEVGDFPAVGQREFRAKAQQYDAAAEPGAAPRVYGDRPEPAQKRGGLFQRLVGGHGRGGQPEQPTVRQASSGKDQKATGTGPDLPFFYSKDKG